ncbi:MAG: elongation factor Ts [Parachlamydiales bacterium]|nr:elongation factor Ts [Parachlamydiales bacterium]
MTQVTAAMVKELRVRTGVGMGKCKEALEEAKGDMELAISNLRKAGIAQAVKKEGRETKEGAIGTAETDKAIAIVEINAETDFVVKNEKFQHFLREMATEIANTNPQSIDSFLSQKASQDTSLTIDQYRATIVHSLGENLKIQRFAIIPKTDDNSVAVYLHMGGKIASVVEITGATGEEALCKDIAMHAAAEAPQYLVESEVPAEVKAQEEDIGRAQVQGKPENVIEKIVQGKLNAFYDQVCLARQKFIKDPSLSITQLVEKRGKEVGKTLTLKRFIRWQVGEAV